MTAGGGSKNTKRNWLRAGVRGIGLALLAVLLVTVDWGRVRTVLGDADLRYLALAGLLNFVFILGKSLRWHSLLGLQGNRLELGWTLRVYQAGSYFSVITPGKVGDFIKAAYLRLEKGIPLSAGLASVVLDRVLDLLALAGAALLVIATSEAAARFLNSIIVFCALVALGVALLFYKGLARAALGWTQHLPVIGDYVGRWRAHLSEVYAHFHGAFQLGGLIPLAFTAMAYTALYGGSYFLARALGFELTVFNVVYCVTVANVVSLLPVSISGVGTRDMAIAVLFGSLGIARSDALVFSLGYFIINLVFANGLGAYFWMRHPIDISSLKGEAADPNRASGPQERES